MFLLDLREKLASTVTELLHYELIQSLSLAHSKISFPCTSGNIIFGGCSQFFECFPLCNKRYKAVFSQYKLQNIIHNISPFKILPNRIMHYSNFGRRLTSSSPSNSKSKRSKLYSNLDVKLTVCTGSPVIIFGCSFCNKSCSQ